MTTWSDRSRWGLCAALTVFIVSMHVVQAFHAGGLWRDEANTVYLATRVTFAENLRDLDHDSFPVLWFVVLRVWDALGLASDGGLRVLGCLIGIGVVAMWWVTARQVGRFSPLWALVLLGMSPVLLRVGDSMRAYGLGVLLVLVAVWATWGMIQKPDARRILLTALTYVLCVQAVFYNALAVLAIGLAAAAVGLRRGSLRLVVGSLGGGAIAAVSLLPYLPVVAKLNTWNMLVKDRISPGAIAGSFHTSVAQVGEWAPQVEWLSSNDWAGPARWIVWAWAALYAGAVIESLRRAGSRAGDEATRDRAVFCAVALLTLVPGYVAFLLYLSYPPNPWYYLTAVALAGLLIDMALAPVSDAARGRQGVMLTLAVLLVVLTVTPLIQAARTAQTNVDRIAAKLNAVATPRDVVVVSPFWCGVSFARYYHGEAPWVNVPDIGSHGIHRYDLVKEAMVANDPLASVRSQVQKLLRAGGRAYLVGGWDFPSSPSEPTHMPPAPHPQYGWFAIPYTMMWSMELSYHFQQHVERLSRIHEADAGVANKFENLPCYVIEGWRDQPRQPGDTFPSPAMK